MSRTFKQKNRKFFPVIGAIMVSLALLLVFQVSISAKANLTSATPSDNQLFKNNAIPGKVTLTFSESLKPDDSFVRVVNAVRNEVQQGTVTINDKTMEVQLQPNLPPADYSVEYSVVSAGDNAETTGSYNFRIVPPAGNPLDAGYQFSTPTDVFGRDYNTYPPLAPLYFVVFLIGAIISNFIYFVGKYRYRNNRLTYTMVNRASRNAAIAFSLGVFFFLCRLGNLQPFNARIWLYITVILLLFYVIRGFIWRTRVYPQAKAEWQELQTRQRRRAPEAVAPVIPVAKPTTAKVVSTSTRVGSGSSDAGGETLSDAEAVREATIPPAGTSPRGVSQRGQKRREKKRDRR